MNIFARVYEKIHNQHVYTKIQKGNQYSLGKLHFICICFTEDVETR